MRTLAEPKESSATSRHCLPGRKGLGGSTSSLIPCQKIRSASVKKGASGSGGIDGAQEMSAAACSGITTAFGQHPPVCQQPRCLSHVATVNTSTSPAASRLAPCQVDQRYLRKGAILAQNDSQRVLRIRETGQQCISSTLAMAVTSATGLVGREAPKNNCAAGSVSTGPQVPPTNLHTRDASTAMITALHPASAANLGQTLVIHVEPCVYAINCVQASPPRA